MLDKYLSGSTLAGTVRELMTPGNAAEFIQPWYTPLPCTPETTGLPFGGIGSAVTVTPASTTPVVHFVPGVQVRGNQPSDLRLANFFYRESVLDGKVKLRISNWASFQRRDAVYPLVDSSGAKLFTGCTTAAAAIKRLGIALGDSKLFEANRDRLQRWGVEFCDHTQDFIDADRISSAEFNFLWLVDYFDGMLGLEATAQGSLTADWNSPQVAGQTAFPSDRMAYKALYPAAVTDYQKAGKARIRRLQWSPVLPGEERLASMPVGYTVFEISNPTKQTLEVTLLQTLQNLVGASISKERPSVQDASFVLYPLAKDQTAEAFDLELGHDHVGRGVLLGQKQAWGDLRGTMAVAVSCTKQDGVTLSVKPMFYSVDEATVVEGALVSGRVNDAWVKNVCSGREVMSTAVCATAVLAPGTKVEVVFGLALDFPDISMPGLLSRKKYASFFPQEVGRAKDILQYALSKEAELRERVAGDYAKLLPAGSLKKLFPKGGPAEAQFRTMAYNTLAFLAEATIWDDADRFLVRECADYPFFNSLDVYFYGSFSLLALMPRLDGEVMRRFSEAVLAENSKLRRHHEFVNHPWADLPDPKLEGPRGVRGAVIHDLGSPFDARPDAYDWHNVKEWKDLAPKFVMMVLRHFKTTGDRKVLVDCKEAVYESMAYLERMVEPGQRFPLTHGTDDTFDNLSSHGVSAYCGSLWIAGLRAAAAIASELGDADKAATWNNAARSAHNQFDDALWDADSGYYHFFATPLQSCDMIADKLSDLPSRLPGVVPAGCTAIQATTAINTFLWEDEPVPMSLLSLAAAAPLRPVKGATLGKKDLRTFKKSLLKLLAGDCFADSFQKRIGLDSDDVFADQMLADTWLRMLDLEPLCEKARAVRALQSVYRLNYKANSPRVGAANLVHPDGSPLDEWNFQAHDVWIGVQHSIVTSMVAHGLDLQARDIEESMYRNLCVEARIPFSAPEGFNATCRLKPEHLMQQFTIKEPAAKKLIAALVKGKVLTDDGRITPAVPRKAAEFQKKFGAAAKLAKVDTGKLFQLVHHTGLKYTAGRYFRPGMVWAIPQACRLAR